MLRLFDLASKLIQRQKKCICFCVDLFSLLTTSEALRLMLAFPLLLPLLQSCFTVSEHNHSIEPATRKPLDERALTIIGQNIIETSESTIMANPGASLEKQARHSIGCSKAYHFLPNVNRHYHHSELDEPEAYSSAYPSNQQKYHGCRTRASTEQCGGR